MPDVPTLTWPVTTSATGIISSREQDELDDVRDSVALICATETGALEFAPNIGLPSLELVAQTRTLSADDVAETIETIDDRASVSVQRMPEPADGEGWDHLTVSVALAGEDTE